MKLRVLTFNIQHCKSYLQGNPEVIDFDLFADTIRCFDPDIVGLNEVRGEGTHPAYTAQAQILAEKLGYHYHFYPALEIGGYGLYGNAILSKYPIKNAQIIPIPDPVRKPEGKFYETRCVAKAEFDLGAGLTVLVTHFGLNPDEQENAVKTVVSQLKKEKCILMGDFNVRPDHSVLDAIREEMKDTASCFDAAKLSYPSDVPDRKIDYIFVSRDVEVESADILPIVASDHRPHVATLGL